MNAERGYFTSSGYMGYVESIRNYQLFASESDYSDFVASVND